MKCIHTHRCYQPWYKFWTFVKLKDLRFNVDGVDFGTSRLKRNYVEHGDISQQCGEENDKHVSLYIFLWRRVIGVARSLNQKKNKKPYLLSFFFVNLGF